MFLPVQIAILGAHAGLKRVQLLQLTQLLVALQLSVGQLGLQLLSETLDVLTLLQLGVEVVLELLHLALELRLLLLSPKISSLESADE